jgi:hypothetical protein
MTESNSGPVNSSTDREQWPEVSMPISLITAMASERTWEDLAPAENTSKRPPAPWRNNPSATWDLAELLVPRITIRFLGVKRHDDGFTRFNVTPRCHNQIHASISASAAAIVAIEQRSQIFCVF